MGIPEKYDERYNRCLRTAEVTSDDDLRQSLLRLAKLCKIEARLVESTKTCLSESRELLARVNVILSARPAARTLREERSSQGTMLRTAIQQVFDDWINEKASPLPRSTSVH